MANKEFDILLDILSEEQVYRFKGKTYSTLQNKKFRGFPSMAKAFDIPSILHEKGCGDLAFQMIQNDYNIPVKLERDIQKAINDSYMEEKLHSEGEEQLERAYFVKRMTPFILVDQSPQEGVVFLDKDNYDRPSDINIQYYYAATGTSYEELVNSPIVAKGVSKFNPYSIERFLQPGNDPNDKRQAIGLNLFIAPDWRYAKAEPAYRGRIKTLIEHLFTDPEEREHVLDWMHYLIVDRNNTILCLVGSRGTGKSILVTKLFRALVGHDYFALAKQSTLEDKFNSDLKNKRLTAFDEIEVTKEMHRINLKQFANDRLSIETKGKDSVTMDNFASMVLITNEVRSFQITTRERRFSIPALTSEKLEKVFTEDEINDFIEELDDPESAEVAEFGEWLMNRKPENSNHKPIVGQYFYEIEEFNYPEWKTEMIELLKQCNGEYLYITRKNIEKMLSKGKKSPMVPYKSKIQEFVENDSYRGIANFATIEDEFDKEKVLPFPGSTGGRTFNKCKFAIAPSPEFLEKYGKAKNKEEIEDIYGDDL